MSDRRPDPMLDRLVQLAREQEPPPLEDEKASDMVRLAMQRAGADNHADSPRSDGQRSVWPRRIAVAAAAAVIPLMLWLGFWQGGQSPDSNSATAQLRATLPTGDRLVATAGAQFHVDSAVSELRQVSIDEGAVLFDVTPLGSDERFEVVTAHLRVEVRGTVFSVERHPDHTTVRVYEGRVEVTQGGEQQLVTARRMWTSSSRTAVPLDDGPLAEAGWDAARDRSAVAQSSTTTAVEAEVPAAVAEPAAVVEPTVVAEPTEPTIGRQLAAPNRLPAGGGDIQTGETRPPAVTDQGDAQHDTPAVTEEESAQAPAETDRTGPPTLDEARRLLLQGQAAEALAAAQAGSGGGWRMLEADSLRALRRFGDAATAYDRAASELSGGRRSQAGYRAAHIRYRQLGDARSALASLDRSGADRLGSPLAERATALRARLLQSLGRTAEARRVAARYLERYPGGGMADWMRNLVEGG